MSTTSVRPRVRVSRRGDAFIPKLPQPVVSANGSSASTISWTSQRKGLIMTTAAAVATLLFSLGSPTSKSQAQTSPSVGDRATFASSARHGGFSIKPQFSALHGGRVLQTDSASSQPVVEYATQLELFMCNPTLEVTGNDAYLVDQTNLSAAIAKVDGLGQADVSAISVTIKTAPTDTEDDSYMCDVRGMLQWHAQIKFSATEARVLGTTPAVMAARANDYVAYSGSEFKSFLTAHINTEYATSAETVDLSEADIVVPTVGWTVTFPSATASQEKSVASGDDGLVVEMADASSLWDWWMWVVYGVLVGCCVVPLCWLACRSSEDKSVVDQQLGTTRNGRRGQGLDKIRGPEWGITELDFEGDHKAYQNQEMKEDYDGAGKGVRQASYRNRASDRAGLQSVSGQAWMQEVGKKSEWAQQRTVSGTSTRTASTLPTRRFDIDDEDADDSVARLREKHPKYSFDMNAGSMGSGSGERKAD